MAIILDVVLVVVLVLYFIYGYRSGLVRSLTGIVGIVIGGFAAVLLVPIVNSWIAEPGFRIAAALAVVVLLVVGGHSAGAAVGGVLYRRVRRVGGLRVIDRILGALLTTVVAALVTSMLAFSVGALGIPVLSQAIGSSTVLRGIDSLTPTPLKSFLAQVRSATVDESLPRIAQALGAAGVSPTIPSVTTDSAALLKAGQSVVRITGNAYACGQSQSGSGFVVSHNRVITNAHVVAGVTEPIVDVRNGDALRATIVYFDPTGDLAVLSVPGLDLAPIALASSNLPTGSRAVADGYPFGGPYATMPVGITAVETINVADIYGQTTNQREVYGLAADVEQGDSGGPLLSTAGTVAGVVFAKGAKTKDVGFAITMTGLAPVAKKAPALTAAVSSGRCTKG